MATAARRRYLNFSLMRRLSSGTGISRVTFVGMLALLLLVFSGLSRTEHLVKAQKVTTINVDPASTDSIVGGMKELVKDIAHQYVKDNSTGYATLGGFLDQNGVSWFGSAIIWGTIYQFSLQTDIKEYDKVAEAALKLAAHNSEGSLLGKASTQSISETLEGKWNDDIGWWMRAFIIGSKKYGCNKTITGNVTYCGVAETTFKQITSDDQLDVKTCGGGIYWSRNRNPASGGVNYKSTITNTIAIGAGTYLQSKGIILDAMNNKVNSIESWLMSTGIVSSNYDVYDGLDPNIGCNVINKALWSYNAGTLISAYVEMINANINVGKYAPALDKLLRTSLATFTDPKGLPMERGCGSGKHPSKCNRDVSSYMSVFIMSVSEAYHITKDEDLKKTIASLIDAGLNEHLRRCASGGCSAFIDMNPLGKGDSFNAYNNLSALSFLLAKHSVMSRNGPPAIVDANANRPKRNSSSPQFSRSFLLSCYVVVALIPFLASL